MTIPYTAVGNDELGEELRSLIDCPHCGKRHRVQQSKSRTLQSDGTWGPWEEKRLMQFYECKGEAYVCGLNGRQLK